MEQLRMIHKMECIPTFYIEDGFSIRLYQKGDEAVWTEICKHGLLTEDEGIECWEKYMLSLPGLDPEQHTFFVCDATGQAIATCTAFVGEDGDGLMHMLAAKPEARGHHLGESMTAYSLRMLDAMMPGDERIVRLKSDDWRLPAVLAYLRAGFQPVLFDVDMDTRWKAICDTLNFHPVEMLTLEGDPTDIIL